MGKNNSNEGGGCLGVLGFIAAICCSPGLLLAVIINCIVPINSAGLIIILLVGTAIGIYLAYLLYKLIGAENIAAVIGIYAVCCVFLLLLLLSSGAAENLFEEVMGDKPYSSLIMNEAGQIAFWISTAVVLVFSLMGYLYYDGKK